MFSRPIFQTLLLTALSISVQALEFDKLYGESSFKFLKLSLSPRVTALGGAGSALVDGIADAEMNPAAAARDSGSLSLGQGYPFQAFSATGSHIAWNIPVSRFRITLHARYLGFDNIAGFDALDNPTAAYGAYTLKMQAGLAGTIWGLHYGVSTAFAQNHIAEANYGTGLLNMGLQRPLLWGLSAGAAVMNADYWTSDAEDGSPLFPPTSVQAGLSYTKELPQSFRISVAVDARTRNDEQITFPCGLETLWKNSVWLRFGYPIAEPEPSPTAGFGLRWSRFGFNYAYLGHTVLSAGHFWTLDVRY